MPSARPKNQSVLVRIWQVFVKMIIDTQMSDSCCFIESCRDDVFVGQPITMLQIGSLKKSQWDYFTVGIWMIAKKAM